MTAIKMYTTAALLALGTLVVYVVALALTLKENRIGRNEDFHLAIRGVHEEDLRGDFFEDRAGEGEFSEYFTITVIDSLQEKEMPGNEDADH